jgi:hypothetical protein
MVLVTTILTLYIRICMNRRLPYWEILSVCLHISSPKLLDWFKLILKSRVHTKPAQKNIVQTGYLQLRLETIDSFVQH